MARIDTLPKENFPELADYFEESERTRGFVANFLLTIGHRPEIAAAVHNLFLAIQPHGQPENPVGTVPMTLKNMVAQVCSRSAGCRYCSTHTAAASMLTGVESEKESALWDYERSDLFSDAERAALRVAQSAGQVPNAVTDADMDDLKKYFSDEQIVEIVSVIAFFGFLNRFNDTMDLDIEAPAADIGAPFLEGGRLGRWERAAE